jgi:hypothetical protein
MSLRGKAVDMQLRRGDKSVHPRFLVVLFFLRDPGSVGDEQELQNRVWYKDT